MLDPIHLLLDGLPQHRIVDHLKDKQRFRNLSKRLQRPIEGVLLRVRVERAEQVRSRHFLEFDGCDPAQDFIPLLKHNLVIRTASGLDLPTDGGEKVCPAKVSRNGCDLLAGQILSDGPIKMIQSDHPAGKRMRQETGGISRALVALLWLSRT